MGDLHGAVATHHLPRRERDSDLKHPGYSSGPGVLASPASWIHAPSRRQVSPLRWVAGSRPRQHEESALAGVPVVYTKTLRHDTSRPSTHTRLANTHSIPWQSDRVDRALSAASRDGLRRSPRVYRTPERPLARALRRSRQTGHTRLRRTNAPLCPNETERVASNAGKLVPFWCRGSCGEPRTPTGR